MKERGASVRPISVKDLLRRVSPSLVLIGLILFIAFPAIYREFSYSYNPLKNSSASDDMAVKVIVVPVNPSTAIADTTVATVKPQIATADESWSIIQSNPGVAQYDLHEASTHTLLTVTASANANMTASRSSVK